LGGDKFMGVRLIRQELSHRGSKWIAITMEMNMNHGGMLRRNSRVWKEFKAEAGTHG